MKKRKEKMDKEAWEIEMGLFLESKTSCSVFHGK